MYAFLQSIFLPYIKVRLYFHSFYSVKGYYVKLPYWFIKFRWVSCRNYYPAFGNRCISECFVLQKLQHSRRKCFWYAVNFIKKKYAFFYSRFFNIFIYRRNYFTHCVFRYSIFFSVECLFFYVRQTDSTLSCMVCHWIRDKTYSHFLWNLLHNSGLSYTGSTYYKNRSLSYPVYFIFTVFILYKIGFNGIFNLCFSFFYIHTEPPF